MPPAGFLLHRSEPLLKAPRPPAAPETRRCRESLGELAAKDNNGSTPTDAPLQPTQRGADLHPLVTRSWNEPSASEWGRSAAAALQDDVTAVRGLADRAPGPTPSEGLISTLRAALIRQDPVWQLVPIYEELCKAIAWVRANGASLEAAHAPVLEPGVILSDAFVWAKTEEGSPWVRVCL